MSVFIIAEVGSAWVFTDDWKKNYNHALRAISIAADAGCSACKFQWTSDPVRMAERRHVERSTYWRLSWPQVWHQAFATECTKSGIEYMCTAYLEADVVAIAPHVQRFKIASLEMNDFGLQTAMVNYGKPVYVSTGCHVELPPLFMKYNVHLLHAVSAYPAPLMELNLAAIDGHRGGQYEGFSDHSANVLTGAVAVAAGATILEVHFRLRNTPPANPDFAHSHPPDQLREYAQNVRAAELMLGDGVKRIQPSEEPLLKHRVTT
jgi:sialic acid synthase SpsE